MTKVLKLTQLETGNRVTVFYDDLAGYRETDDKAGSLLYLRGGHTVKIAKTYDEMEALVAEIIDRDSNFLNTLLGGQLQPDDTDWEDDTDDAEDFSKKN